MAIVYIFNFFFTFVLSSYILSLAIFRFTTISTEHKNRLFFCFLGLGPLLISWVFNYEFLILPAMPKWAYATIIYVLFFLLFLYGYQERFIPKISLKFENKNFIRIKFLLIFFIITMLVGILYFTLWTPYTENDAMQYIALSQVLFAHKTTAIYPLLDTRGQGGMYTPWTHPLAYPALLMWLQWINSGSTYVALLFCKFTPYFYFISIVFLLMYFLEKLHLFWRLFGVFLLATSPCVIFATIVKHIDDMRMYSFILPLLVYIMLHDMKYGLEKIRYSLFFAFTLGMALYSHSEGILSIPLFATIYFLNRDLSFKRKIINYTVIVLCSLMFVVYRYYLNYLNFGAIVGDSNPVWNLPIFQTQKIDLFLIGLNNLQGRILNSYFPLLVKVKYYGIIYWLLMLLLVLSIKKIRIKNFFYYIATPWKRNQITNNEANLMMIWNLCALLIAFLFLIFVTVLFGEIVFIKNFRYIMIIQPIAILLCVMLCDNLYSNSRRIL